MYSGFYIDHQCPQCGAPVTLAETDRLISCEFCRVRSYLVTPDVFRYVLPHKTNGRDLFYFPYWRFKGTFFSCAAGGVTHRVVDTSAQGVGHPVFPASLGLRAQAMHLRFATPDTAGIFLQPEHAPAAATDAFVTRLGNGSAEHALHREFIGETLSLIYSPFCVDQHLVDAVLDRVRVPDLPEDFVDNLPPREEPHWPIRFVPTLCPHCGRDLQGERDSLVLFCNNCHSAWGAGSQELTQLDFHNLFVDPDASIYLPFWRMTIDVSGLQLSSYADLARVMNLPAVPRADWEALALHFWTPAFKVRPGAFLRLARRVTVAQPEPSDSSEVPERSIHPVTLPIREASECVRLVLSDLIDPESSVYQRIGEIGTRLSQVELVLIPFRQKGHELGQPALNLAINRNAIRFGRQL